MIGNRGSRVQNVAQPGVMIGVLLAIILMSEITVADWLAPNPAPR